MMTRWLLTLAIALTACALLYAQEKNTVKLNGYLIDNMCAGAHVNEATFKDRVKKHTVSCALMPNCAKSGYAVYTSDGKLYKFDEAGNKSTADLLKDTETKSGMMVVVEGTLEGDTIKVTNLSEVKAEGGGR
jgi:hypothetical protein